MLLTLEPLKAHEGDCLLLHWGTVANPKLAVIDGGPTDIFATSLKPRLEQIRQNRALVQLPIDLVMVSHVDNDHVVGIKRLFQQLRDEIDDNVPAASRHFGVKRLWHNTFNDILGDSIDKFFTTLTASIEASIGGAPNPELVDKLAKECAARDPADPHPEETARDIALLLAGHGEGRDLRKSFRFVFDHNQIATLNAPFQKNGAASLVTAEDDPAPVSVSGLSVKVVGPLRAEIEALQEEFDEFITAKGLVEASLLAAYSDPSVKNLSSIVCLVELAGKRILLTGDARGDKTIAGLEQAGLLNGGPLEVDILKVPHHGSDRNVKTEYFESIVADTYVFSGDGKNGNPDRSTMKMLTDARGKNAAFKVILTYPIDEIDAARKADHEKKGHVWNKAAHSLEAFFDECHDDGFAFTVHAGAPVKLNLGDETPPW